MAATVPDVICSNSICQDFYFRLNNGCYVVAEWENKLLVAVSIPGQLHRLKVPGGTSKLFFIVSHY